MRVLRRDTDDPPGLNDRLMELGFDSLMAVQLRDQIGKALALPAALPATLMFDYPTIERLAGYLLRRLLPGEPPATDAPVAGGGGVCVAGESAGPVGSRGDRRDDAMRRWSALLSERLGRSCERMRRRADNRA